MSELKELQRKQQCNDCTLRERRFQDVNSPRIALASFPGSGNTWLRHLIEQITGVYSGSVYQSGNLMKYFPGEKYRDRRVSVVKTHKENYKDASPFDKAIVVHRNIKDCFVSNFKRLSSGNNYTGSLTRDQFNGRWLNFIQQDYRHQGFSKFWDLWWTMFPERPKLLIEYDDLVSDLYPQLVRIRDFLNAGTTDEQLFCVMCQSEGSFRRKKDKEIEDPWKDVPAEISKKFDESDEYVNKLISSLA